MTESSLPPPVRGDTRGLIHTVDPVSSSVRLVVCRRVETTKDALPRRKDDYPERSTSRGQWAGRGWACGTGTEPRETFGLRVSGDCSGNVSDGGDGDGDDGVRVPPTPLRTVKVHRGLVLAHCEEVLPSHSPGTRSVDGQRSRGRLPATGGITVRVSCRWDGGGPVKSTSGVGKTLGSGVSGH